ncbi:DUF397 domain-containing protein [Actinomadura atramentaria]|uniref:DUF397 domain-containing protein n=1 Tax=Actinomadura atramentaria TaxID=1990 RepID=UPI000361AB6E|nr:DUF397 domain-containing protein [Actinomadura atramentaria]
MDTLTWRKAKRSNINGGNCVELARAANVFYARDSKATDDPQHALSLPGAAAFIEAVKRGMYDL